MLNLFKKKYNKLTVEEDEDVASCMIYNINTNKSYRDYLDDFIDYNLININSNFDIIINNNLKNVKTYKCKTYFNKNLNYFYYMYEEDIYFENLNGMFEIIVKTNNNIIGTLNFKYKLNSQEFNSEVLKIIKNNNILYLFLKKDINDKYNHIYKIIFTKLYN